MRISVLGSGSSGNSIFLQAGNTRLLVDAGFSGRSLAERLSTIGVEAENIDAIVVTHEHGDHTSGIGVYARRYGTPLYMTQGTQEACSKLFKGQETVLTYDPGRSFHVGDARVEPFLTVHDAVDPVGVAIVDECTGLRVGVATDLGRPTSQIRHALSDCDFLVLEANHGHLSNQAAARFAVELMHPRLAGIVLAHLSKECNSGDLALKVVGGALKEAGWSGYLDVAEQNHPTALLDIEDLRYREGPAQLSLI